MDDPVAVLSALQNADKHRNLVSVISGLVDPEMWIDGQKCKITFASVVNPAIKNGALVYACNDQVKVEIKGTATIGIGRPNEVRDFRGVVDGLMDYIAKGALASLEPFLS